VLGIQSLTYVKPGIIGGKRDDCGSVSVHWCLRSARRPGVHIITSERCI
jgi:hypothetical protein